MTTFYAVDNEFAASTGSNVNNGYGGPGTSQFDYPPNATMDLTVSTRPGDTQAELFEVGEAYTVAWQGGPGGGAYIENATVLRSDTIGPDQGVIVFEGLDENGDLTQVVWSPGYDLEQWYWDNFSGGESPGFYTTDQIAGNHTYICFDAATRLATARGGRRRIDELQVGDRLRTRDHGQLPILHMTEQIAPGIGKSAPICIAPGTFDNEAELRLSPNHRVLLTGWEAELLFGCSAIYVPAKALLTIPGVQQRAQPRVRYWHVLLPVHAAVLAEGVACESLLVTDLTSREIRACLPQGQRARETAYPCATPYEARPLAQQMARCLAAQRGAKSSDATVSKDAARA